MSEEMMEYGGAIALSLMDRESEIILGTLSLDGFPVRLVSISNIKILDTILETVKNQIAKKMLYKMLLFCMKIKFISQLLLIVLRIEIFFSMWYWTQRKQI